MSTNSASNNEQGNKPKGGSKSRRKAFMIAGAVATAAAGAAGAASLLSPQVAFAGTTGLPVFDVKASYGALGNGLQNDLPNIQNAINDAQTAGGGIVWLPAGNYKLDITGTALRTLTISKQVILAGAGWDATNATPANGTWLSVVNTQIVAITVAGNDVAKGTVIRDIAIRHTQPTPGAGAFTPSAYDYAIKVGSGDVHLHNIFLLNPTKGILIYNPQPNSAIGRVTLDRIWGQPLNTGITIDNAQDVIKVNNVHFWIFWNPLPSVLSYQRTNGKAIVSFRNDNPHFSNIFVLHYNTGFSFQSNANGPTHKFHISNADLDLCNVAVEVLGAGTTGQITNLSWEGSDGGSGQTGAFGVRVGTAADASVDDVRIQISNADLRYCTGNGIRVKGTNSHVFVENVFVDGWNQSGIGFPAIEAVSPGAVYIGIGRLFVNGGNGAWWGGSGTVKVGQWMP